MMEVDVWYEAGYGCQPPRAVSAAIACDRAATRDERPASSLAAAADARGKTGAVGAAFSEGDRADFWAAKERAICARRAAQSDRQNMADDVICSKMYILYSLFKMTG
jgi:hypothetical protein